MIVDSTGGQAHRGRQSLVAHPEQFAKRPVRPGNLCQRGRVLGIMQVQQVNAVETQGLEAFFEGAACLSGIEPARLGVTVELRRQDEAVGKSSSLANDRSDPLLTAPEAIVPRCIEKSDRTGEHLTDRLLRLFLSNAIAICVGHVAESRRAETQLRDAQIGVAQGDGINSACGHGRFLDRSGFGERAVFKKQTRGSTGKRCRSSRRNRLPDWPAHTACPGSFVRKHPLMRHVPSVCCSNV